MKRFLNGASLAEPYCLESGSFDAARVWPEVGWQAILALQTYNNIKFMYASLFETKPRCFKQPVLC